MRKFGLLALIVPTILAASIAAARAFALQGGSSAYPTASSALSAEITSKLDTKNATVGEAVTAKTLSSTTLANGTAIPRGAMLNGKVTAVQSKSSGGGTASVTVSFDQIMPSKIRPPFPFMELSSVWRPNRLYPTLARAQRTFPRAPPRVRRRWPVKPDKACRIQAQREPSWWGAT